MENKQAAFVSSFIKSANDLVEEGLALDTVPSREREAFLAASKRVIGGLESFGVAALSEAEKLLVVIFEYTKDGVFFAGSAPEKYKTAFVELLDAAGTACQPT